MGTQTSCYGKEPNMMIFGFHIVDMVVITTYLLGITAIGMYMAKKVKNEGDFFLGGRKFGKVFSAARDFGMSTSTDEPVIVVGQAYSIGLAGIWYALVNIFATPFYWITKPWFRRLRLYTMGDFCEKRFGKKFGYFYSFFGLVVTSAGLGMILRGASSAVLGASGGVIPLWTMVLVMATLFILYGAFGGQHAAVVTDFIQAIFIVILSVLLIPFSIANAGGIAAITERIPEGFFSLVASGGEVTFWFVVTAILVALNSSMGYPSTATVIGKTEWETRIGMTSGVMLKRLCTVAWAFSGLFFLAIMPNISKPDEVFGTAISHVLPIGFIGLMAAALMAAAMSTCDGMMVVSGAYFVENFYKKAVRGRSAEHYLFVSRTASVATACLGVFFALVFPTLVDLLKYLWCLQSFVGITTWVSLGWRRANRWGAWSTVFITFIIHGLCTYYFKFPFALTAGLYLLVGYGTMVIVSLLTPREPEEQLDEFYALLHTPVGQEERLKYAEVEILHY